MNLKKALIWFTLFIFVSLCSSLIYADPTVGAISGNLHESASILAKVLWAACIIVGIILFFTAFTQFQIHRTNPKLVPLTVPITYLILSIGAILIPFAERIVDVIQGLTVEEEIRTNSGY